MSKEKVINPETVEEIAEENKTINKITNTEKENDEKEAIATAKELKKDMVRIKIPVDPLNKDDLQVPVMINGYLWNIKRGETVEVPSVVADILQEAKYI